MPELPEVETIVRELRRRLPGRRIAEVEIFRGDALGSCPPQAFRRALVGATFEEVQRRGKFLLFGLGARGFLIAHLRMTGKFVLSPPLPEPLPHHRVWFRLADGEVLVFQDLRCLGTLQAVETLAQSASIARLGIEPLSRRFTSKWLGTALSASKSPLKHWLMDQSKIAGLGNIYVAEILYRAGLSPLRAARALGSPEVERLHGAVREVLRQAIRKNGTTISDFRRVDEKKGEFQHLLKVYGKKGENCPRCRTPIARIRQQQRSTFFCPTCQT